MPTLLIFSIAAALSSAAIVGLFAYRLQWIKKIRISFPETSERFFDSLLKHGFGNGKIEKYASRCMSVSQDVAVRCALYARNHNLTLKIKNKVKNRVDRFLGKSAAIPDRETSSVFLKSIAEYKKHTHEEEEENLNV